MGIFHKAGRMKASRWEPVDDEPSVHKSRWENEDEDDVPKSKWEREDDDEKADKFSKESSEISKWQRVSDSPRDRLDMKSTNFYDAASLWKYFAMFIALISVIFSTT